MDSRADKPPKAPQRGEDGSETVARKIFKLIEHFLLALATIMTLIAMSSEIATVYGRGAISLADILLMFLYTEVIGMIAVFYSGRGSLFVFPIFIAITALARLIVLQGKDMAPENVVFEASAILLLSIAAFVIGRVRSS